MLGVLDAIHLESAGQGFDRHGSMSEKYDNNLIIYDYYMNGHVSDCLYELITGDRSLWQYQGLARSICMIVRHCGLSLQKIPLLGNSALLIGMAVIVSFNQVHDIYGLVYYMMSVYDRSHIP